MYLYITKLMKNLFIKNLMNLPLEAEQNIFNIILNDTIKKNNDALQNNVLYHIILNSFQLMQIIRDYGNSGS